ncbi:preprotein translocase subunit SecG [Buchnera aphidicola]|uniref:Protein-export membrane protein SecG n=1 Tax=Buchnera aphidicola (Aphis aurantii) TaxID=1470492 RepID=A0AAU6W5V3_9GAMM
MYLFFLVFLIVISICLNFLILLQPSKGMNDIIHSNTSNIKLFNNFKNHGFITNFIGLCACLFLIISLILCNLNDKKTNLNLFKENDNTLNKKILNVRKNKTLNTEIPR